jgi:hypothetical protein
MVIGEFIGLCPFLGSTVQYINKIQTHLSQWAFLQRGERLLQVKIGVPDLVDRA